MALKGSAGLAGVTDDPEQDGTRPTARGYVAPTEPEDDGPDAQEAALVAKWWKEWEEARKFDENFRQQVAIDRRYAAGTADLSWAVSTNIIGSQIDTLTSLLYARDPDVSAKKAPQTDDEGSANMDMFARTLQIVVSYYWRRGKLKKAAKKAVRSTLSVSEGWFKATMIAEKVPQPQVETALNDARETLAQLEAEQKLLDDPDFGDPDARQAEMDEKQKLIEDLERKLELAVSKMFVIDFVRTENMQVSTDVEAIEDHLDADWNGNEIFIPRDEALARFPRLTTDDLKAAEQYYQREPKKRTNRDSDNVLPQGELTAESSLAFSQSQSERRGRPFVRVVEIWGRKDKQIRTLVHGVKKWAVEPYTPPYPTSRFYPYFYIGFYEVDGERHPQSLSWRLFKLQDEYSTSRSNFRLTRERSIPGTLFNATQIDNEEAAKLEKAKHQEYTPIRPMNPDAPMANLFTAKPVAQVDMRLFDPSLIVNDIERVSGVQEALSAVAQGPGNPVTATEANIQQQGTSARTTSARDALEWCLSDMALYSAEQMLQCVTVREAQRIAGKKAFWLGPDPDGINGTPDAPGMSIEDLFTLCEIEILAGSTGKPKAQGDQAVWAQLLPMIEAHIDKIQQALASGNVPVAKAFIELVKETMRRAGDDGDVDRFIPQIPPPGSPGSGAQPPPIVPDVHVSLKGTLDPQTSDVLAEPAVERDQVARPPGNPLAQPGGAPGGMPPGAPPMGSAGPPAGPAGPPGP